LEFLGPLGNFVLRPEDESKEILFLGTGSGIAPLKAMIEDLIRVQHSDIPMTLYFGLRHEADIFWNEYFQSLTQEFPQLKFVLCLSKPEATWKGASGHITDLIASKNQDLSHASAYLCGGLKMIEEAKTLLASLHMPAERIYHEKFF